MQRPFDFVQVSSTLAWQEEGIQADCVRGQHQVRGHSESATKAARRARLVNMVARVRTVEANSFKAKVAATVIVPTSSSIES